MVSTGHGGVPRLGQDILVVLGVDQHTEPQVILHLPPGHVPLRVLLILLHAENGFHVNTLHLRTHSRGGRGWAARQSAFGLSKNILCWVCTEDPGEDQSHNKQDQPTHTLPLNRALSARSFILPVCYNQRHDPQSPPPDGQQHVAHHPGSHQA